MRAFSSIIEKIAANRVYAMSPASVGKEVGYSRKVYCVLLSTGSRGLGYK